MCVHVYIYILKLEIFISQFKYFISKWLCDFSPTMREQSLDRVIKKNDVFNVNLKVMLFIHNPILLNVII